MPISSTAVNYEEYRDLTETVRDVCEGARKVKKRGEKYLPHPNPRDLTSVNAEVSSAARLRYSSYVQRAVFYNVTGRTEEGLIGAIFRIDPQHELPPDLEYMAEDCDGAGSSLTQFSKRVCSEAMRGGIVGVLADYPPVDGPITLEQQQSSNIRAKLAVYPMESIRNFRADMINGVMTLTMVVLYENQSEPVDEFSDNWRPIYRVLSLRDGVYTQRVFDEAGVLQSEIVPRKADGSTWDHIPFAWIGCTDNRCNYQIPLLADIAEVNLAQYRNSADYEEGVFITGQPTLFISSAMSLDEFNRGHPTGIQLGSRAAHFIGMDGTATLVQMQPNSIAHEAIRDKFDAMVSLGARLITKTGRNETAEAARIHSSGESSALNTLVGNVSEGIEKALEFASEFMGSDPEAVVFNLSREFFDEVLTPQEVMAMIQLADRGDVAQSDIRARMRKAGWIDVNRTDEDIDAEASNNGAGLMGAQDVGQQTIN